MHFVFPPDGLSEKEIEPHFLAQADALRALGFTCSIVQDDVFAGRSSLRRLTVGGAVTYRGWMVSLTDYDHFERAVNAVGASCVTTTALYALTHWLPNWYELLREFTAETVFLPADCDLVAELRQVGWSGYFLKDFVKSLKTDGGSIVTTPEDGERWRREILVYRDELEGGIAVRRVEDFVPGSEVRYFVLEHRPYAPDGEIVPDVVRIAAERIASRFFTVDVAGTKDGDIRIVELGDGQVSDLVGWTATRFAEVCKNAWQQE